jgi:hypothetical protein
VVNVLGAGVVEADVVGGPAGTELGALSGQLADEVSEVPVVGVAASGGAEDGDHVAGGAVPVDVEIAGAGVEEDVAGAVDRARAGGSAEHVGVEGVAELVGGEVVQAGVVDDRRCAGEPVEDVLDAWPHASLGCSLASRRDAQRSESAG